MATTTLLAPAAPRWRPRGALRGPVLGRNALVLRHQWTSLLFGVLEPVLYLLSIGIGVGKMVGHIDGLGGADVTYAEYVGPALMAMAAMNGAVNSTTQAIFVKLKYENTYQIMLTTPLMPRDIALGEVCTALLRGSVESVGFLGIMALMGMVRSPWALLALPGALLVGFSFAAMGLVAATYVRDWQDFQTLQLVMLPMFLFATTFYPLQVYPGPIQALVRCLPLYHSIDLLREPILGEVGLKLLIPAGYLLAAGVAALWVGLRRLERRLED
ncbi:MAG TPA: ABC transporter permease [Actinocrinis sp.]|nr:ABC transporter permease [Actinocrinis sp.]